MNTPTQSQLETNAAPLPDYQLAARELDALFASLSVTATVENGRGARDLAQDKDGWPWPNFACEVVYRDRSGQELARIPWRMGTGLIDWKELAARTRDSYSGLLARGYRLRPECEVAAINGALREFAKAVKPAEVLARYAADAEEASSLSFDDWCGNFGYDTDSRKALRTYLACQKGMMGVRAVLAASKVTIAQLAELSRRL